MLASENFYTCPRLTFLKKIATGNAYKSISEPLDFKIFWWGACPQNPLVACTCGARHLPRHVLKSGYGPEGAGMPVKNFELNP